jgi:hypothetical protein
MHASSALLGLAGRPGVRPSDRDRAVAAWIEAQLFRINGYRGVAAAVRGGSAPATCTQRLHGGRLSRRLFQTAGDRRGADAMLLEGYDPWGVLLLASRGWTIGGGTTEIQRNMLGEKILGLPREPKPA